MLCLAGGLTIRMSGSHLGRFDNQFPHLGEQLLWHSVRIEGGAVLLIRPELRDLPCVAMSCSVELSVQQGRTLLRRCSVRMCVRPHVRSSASKSLVYTALGTARGSQRWEGMVGGTNLDLPSPCGSILSHVASCCAILSQEAEKVPFVKR